MQPSIASLPKAELHCHIEGAAEPLLVLQLAEKYRVDVSSIIDPEKGYLWSDFSSFLKAYDLAASLFRTPEDYILLTKNHFSLLASQNCIYGEIFGSSEHAARIGCSYQTLVDAMAEGIAQANQAHGIEGRIIMTGVRHISVEAVEEAARLAVKYPHKMVTGFGMAGDERIGEPKDFARAFDIARDGGLALTCHAGEFGGPASVCEVLDHLKVSRIGHGVRSIEDPNLVQRLAEEGIVLEVCPVSNIVLEVFESFDKHPLRQLHEAGVKVTLNTDDPPHFHASINKEYDVASTEFGFSEEQLLGFTRTAINSAFVDGETRKALLEKCDAGGLR